MNIEDLKKVLHVTQTSNLQRSAKVLYMSAGGLSKIVTKVEQGLHTRLFERVGKNIQLNDNGKRFALHAHQLVHDYEQLASHFKDATFDISLILCGPAIITDYWMSHIFNCCDLAKTNININTEFEGDAIKRVEQGGAHIALVSAKAIVQLSPSLQTIKLTSSVAKVMASATHPLWSTHPSGKLSVAQLNDYGFACLSASPFCGIEQGLGSDGWRDDKIKRRIQFRCDELNSLMSIVKNGLAVAYLPDYMGKIEQLRALEITDCPWHCDEEIYLVWRPSTADGWLNRLISNIEQTLCQHLN
ncbi:MAG: LysR family transcriptional regulator [Moritella sp.]|uniref:LysR family transcriptional regulator n=1 Tax=Moritella sp. TaxID=78556 RepID=UPI001D7C8023|nr:LysR family transcriptional regulator [Moritella sp.]NQZ51037.1 LysR family transcriptional regulator [Moritella sp.]